MDLDKFTKFRKFSQAAFPNENDNCITKRTCSIQHGLR